MMGILTKDLFILFFPLEIKSNIKHKSKSTIAWVNNGEKKLQSLKIYSKHIILY